MSDTTHISETVSAGQLRAFIERVERLEEEIKTLNGDKSEVYKEMRGCGFDVKAVRQCVAARKLDSAEREERNAIFDLYWSALTGSVHVHTPAREIIEEFPPHDPETGEITDTQEQPETAEPFQAKASEDNGSITGGAGAVTGEVSRVDAGRTASATSERMDVTAGETAPIPHSAVTPPAADKTGAAPLPSNAAPVAISDEDVPAFLRKERKPLRPNCQHPDNCAGYGTHTCHSCTVAAREVEPA